MYNGNMTAESPYLLIELLDNSLGRDIELLLGCNLYRGPLGLIRNNQRSITVQTSWLAEQNYEQKRWQLIANHPYTLAFLNPDRPWFIPKDRIPVIYPKYPIFGELRIMPAGQNLEKTDFGEITGQTAYERRYQHLLNGDIKSL